MPRIAQQIHKAFGTDTDKDIVRRILAKHYRPDPGGGVPSWLTMLGDTKDRLWSIDLFHCESISLKNHWVLVAIAQFTRHIVGFGVHAVSVDGVALCRMFNTAISSKGVPNYLSSDNDPLFLYHQWKAKFRIIDADEIEAIPYAPLSNPFVERVIGTIRREFVDRTLFWNASNLQRKLADFRQYYNSYGAHTALDGVTPVEFADERKNHLADIGRFHWKSHCRSLYQRPIAA